MYCSYDDFYDYRPFIIECNYRDPFWMIPEINAKIVRISKHLLKAINSKTRTVKRLQRARESHRRVLLEEEVEQDA